MAFLFLPGTFVHEAAHALSALFLLVPVSDFELMPRMEKDGVKLGSVQIMRVDPFRRFIIGIAPIIVGVSILLGALWYSYSHIPFTSWWMYGVLVYILFEIGNTMFSSKRDLDGALELLIITFIFGSLFYFLGFRGQTIIIPNTLQTFFQTASIFLLIPFAIDLVIIILIRILLSLQNR